jgi:GAF domain-containing protein
MTGPRSEPSPPDPSLTGLTATLSTLAGVVLSEETLDAVLDMIVSLALSSIPDVYGASVSLARDGQLVTPSATSDTVRELDALQYATERGPCVDATRTGITQHEMGSALIDRWPEFGTSATEHGIVNMLSTPLEARGRPVGALNLYGQTEHAFPEDDVNLAAVFARHAGAVLANAAAFTDAETTNQNLLEALTTRQLIGQAMGIIMAREHCSSDDAFDVLRRASQHANVKLRDIAAEFVRSAEPDSPTQR